MPGPGGDSAARWRYRDGAGAAGGADGLGRLVRHGGARAPGCDPGSARGVHPLRRGRDHHQHVRHAPAPAGGRGPGRPGRADRAAGGGGGARGPRAGRMSGGARGGVAVDHAGEQHPGRLPAGRRADGGLPGAVRAPGRGRSRRDRAGDDAVPRACPARVPGGEGDRVASVARGQRPEGPGNRCDHALQLAGRVLRGVARHADPARSLDRARDAQRDRGGARSGGDGPGTLGRPRRRLPGVGLLHDAELELRRRDRAGRSAGGGAGLGGRGRSDRRRLLRFGAPSTSEPWERFADPAEEAGTTMAAGGEPDRAQTAFEPPLLVLVCLVLGFGSCPGCCRSGSGRSGPIGPWWLPGS